jgi:undecaprenyl-phosphate 4-deoxy-4-formamido-L-arabinose transferase
MMRSMPDISDNKLIGHLMSNTKPSLSIVIPVYNGALSIPVLAERLSAILPTLSDHYEVIMVEDGGKDNGWEVIQELARKHTWLRGIKMMRNYGQHNALLCGIREAEHEVIITMDDDLEHPPEELHKLLAKLNEGYDVVYGAPLEQQHGWLRDFASQITKIVLQGSMGAESARNISALRAFRTYLRQAFKTYQSPFVNLDVLLTWGTTRFTLVRVRHDVRQFGVSNYTFRRLVTHAFNMMTGFSTVPLQLASWLGFIMTAFGLTVLFYVVVIRVILLGYEVPGFTFLASMVAIFSGAQMFALGIIGEYLARMHFRITERPTYVIHQTTEVVSLDNGVTHPHKEDESLPVPK